VPSVTVADYALFKVAAHLTL